MKFSIRDLAWLTLVVALVLGWYLDVVRINARHDEQQLNDALNAQLDAENRVIQANLLARQVEAVHV